MKRAIGIVLCVLTGHVVPQGHCPRCDRKALA